MQQNCKIPYKIKDFHLSISIIFATQLNYQVFYS